MLLVAVELPLKLPLSSLLLSALDQKLVFFLEQLIVEADNGLVSLAALRIRPLPHPLVIILQPGRVVPLVLTAT